MYFIDEKAKERMGHMAISVWNTWKTAIRRIGVTKNRFSIMPNGSVKLLICLRFVIINLPCKAPLFAHCSFPQRNNSKQTRFS